MRSRRELGPLVHWRREHSYNNATQGHNPWVEGESRPCEVIAEPTLFRGTQRAQIRIGLMASKDADKGKEKDKDKDKAKAKAHPQGDAKQQKAEAKKDKEKEKDKAKAKEGAEAAKGAKEAKEEKPKAAPRPPADPRLKVLKKFHGKFLPRGPLRDRLKVLMDRWNSGEEHGGVTFEELKSLHNDWRTAREKPSKKKASVSV